MNITIGWACRLHHERKKCMQNFSSQIIGKWPPRKARNIPAIADSVDVERGQLCPF
jgi:hypothetical protein